MIDVGKKKTVFRRKRKRVFTGDGKQDLPRSDATNVSETDALPS